MCVITDANHVVVSVSLILGTKVPGESYHVYFPVVGDLPNEGDVFIGERQEDGTFRRIK